MELRSAEPTGSKEMEMNVEAKSSLKAFVCGAAALALTAVFSWSFVESTSVARWVSTQTTVNVADAAASTAKHVAKSGVAALVD
jgi:hypothetical protein